MKGRLTDSVELALKIGEGRLLVGVEGEEPFWLSERFACVDCGISLPPIEPRMFSFNGPHGACPACDGLGARTVIDPERLVGDPDKTLREGVVLAWGRRGSVSLATEVHRAVQALGVSADTPWAKLSDDDRKAILFGAVGGARKGRGKTKPAHYVGIATRLEARLADEGSDEGDAGDSGDPDEGEGAITDDELGRFVVRRTCAECKGRRLRPEARLPISVASTKPCALPWP